MKRIIGRAVFAAIICLCCLRVQAAGTFNLVGTHPAAAAQPSGTGKTLAALTAFNGKIYAGFGDYTGNYGPIGIHSFNPATNTFSDRLLNDPTEAVYQFRHINGKLYAPDIDPLSGESSGGYAVGTVNGASESWQHKGPVTAIHMYDVSGYGGNLWMAGAKGNNALVWRSTDNGLTWSESLNVLPSGGYSYIRIYGMGEYGGKLYASVDAETRTKSRVFDGTSWSDGPSLLPGGGLVSNASTFAGYMVYQSWECGLSASRMYKFDGTSVSSISTESVYDYKIVGDTMYSLVPYYEPSGGSVGWTLVGMAVKSTTDLTNWQTLAVAPVTARSLAILGDQLFVGATLAELYKYSLPIPEPASMVLLAAGTLALLRRRRIK